MEIDYVAPTQHQTQINTVLKAASQGGNGLSRQQQIEKSYMLKKKAQEFGMPTQDNLVKLMLR